MGITKAFLPDGFPDDFAELFPAAHAASSPAAAHHDWAGTVMWSGRSPHSCLRQIILKAFSMPRQWRS